MLAMDVPLVNSGFESTSIAPWFQFGDAPVISIATDTVHAVIASSSSSYDVNGDGRVTALDALLIMNRLSQQNLVRSRATDDLDWNTQGTLAQWILALLAGTQ